nr:hypothetical protein [Tanacetum cinerariifolium]
EEQNTDRGCKNYVRIVEETLNIRFLENAPNVKGNGPDWLFDIDSLTISMNYEPVVARKQTNGSAGTKDNIVAGQAKKKKKLEQEYILIPICITDPLNSQGPKDNVSYAAKKATETEHLNSTDSFNTVVSLVNNAGPSFANTASPSQINASGTPASTNAFEEHPFERFSPFKNAFYLPDDPIMTLINDTGIFGNAYDNEAVEEEVDMNNVKPVQALKDPSWVEAIQDELLQFKLLKVWTLVDLPKDKWEIGTKWVFRNKKDERGIVGSIDKTLFIKRHKDDILLVQVYVDDIIFGSTKKELSTEFEKLIHDKFQMSSMGELSFFLGLQTASTLMEPNKALVKDAEAEDVDVHLYRSMIRSLMYLTTSKPDITFAVCTCVRFQVTPKTSNLHALKRIFIYLKGQPKLALWYPRDSPFDLEAYSNSDYAGASLDRKFTAGGC